MWVIGLTGGIGSGKSSVAQWLKEQGLPVLDADQTVHSLLSEDQPTIQHVVETFGKEILDLHGKIDRRILGTRVFKDEVARKSLEQLLHPRVKKQMLIGQNALESAGAKLCIWDVPLLFETGFDALMDEVWVVWVSPEDQLTRVMNRDSLSRSEVELRIMAQWSLEDKLKRADVVINNSGSWAQTVLQLVALLERIKDGV